MLTGLWEVQRLNRAGVWEVDGGVELTQTGKRLHTLTCSCWALISVRSSFRRVLKVLSPWRCQARCRLAASWRSVAAGAGDDDDLPWKLNTGQDFKHRKNSIILIHRSPGRRCSGKCYLDAQFWQSVRSCSCCGRGSSHNRRHSDDSIGDRCSHQCCMQTHTHTPLKSYCLKTLSDI